MGGRNCREDGWIDRWWMDGRTDGRTDGRMQGFSTFLHNFFSRRLLVKPTLLQIARTTKYPLIKIPRHRLLQGDNTAWYHYAQKLRTVWRRICAWTSSHARARRLAFLDDELRGW